MLAMRSLKRRQEGGSEQHSRQSSSKHSHADDSQESPQTIESLDSQLESRPERRRLKSLDTGHNPKRSHAQNRPDDGQQDEARPPVEDPRRNARHDAPGRETQGVARAEAGKGPVLALRGHRVGGAEDANRGRDDHGRGEAEDAAEDVHPEGVLGKGDDEAAGAEEAHAEEEDELATDEVGELAEGELKGACSESV